MSDCWKRHFEKLMQICVFDFRCALFKKAEVSLLEMFSTLGGLTKTVKIYIYAYIIFHKFIERYF